MVNFADALLLENLAYAARVRDRYVRVIDNRLAIGHHGVARNAEGQRSVVHPVWARGVAITLDASVVEGENAFGGAKHAHAGASPRS